MRCGEKWNKEHKCPEKVAMHVLDEVLAALQPDQSKEDPSDDSSDDDDEDIFTLSEFAAEGVQGKKTIKLSGMVNKQDLDSHRLQEFLYISV
jgi:hypothetical protein